MPQVTRYKTQNSVYEVCQEEKLARRITGKVEPTPYTGQDGKWKKFIACYPSELAVEGSRVLVIVWHFKDDTGFGTTITSLIKDEEHCGEERKCPECAQGKCANCDGTGWDEVLDEPMFCQCTDPTHVKDNEVVL